jgi:Zn-dependent protease with chaperone function
MAVTRNRSIRSLWLLALAVPLVHPAGTLHADDPDRPASRITRYDIATRDDLLLSHLVAPTMAGDIERWSKQLLGGMPGQVGGWVTQFLDATAMANVITEAFPIEGQPGFRPVDEVVAECARILGVDKPDVYLRNSPQTRIYTVQASGRYHLVITSALLNLFEKRPAELRFVVGRELGHIKCGHPELKRKAYAVLSAIQAIDAAVVPPRYQNVLPLLALGRLLTWCRESEFSADRGGLLCCGEPKTAYEAIMRLQHGLRADSPWIDPESKGFDPQAVIRTFKEWQYQPFIRFINDIKHQLLEHPYYPERLAMLKVWADSGAPRAILGRRVDPAEGQLIEIIKIQAFELAGEGQTVDPYVLVTDGDRQVLQTQYVSAVRNVQWTGFRSTDPGVDQPRAFSDGQPLFFEIWDANYSRDTFVGGFVVYPGAKEARPGADGEYLADNAARILWDWKEPQSVSRPGHARVWVRFTKRQAPVQAEVTREAGR